MSGTHRFGLYISDRAWIVGFDIFSVNSNTLIHDLNVTYDSVYYTQPDTGNSYAVLTVIRSQTTWTYIFPNMR